MEFMYYLLSFYTLLQPYLHKKICTKFEAYVTYFSIVIHSYMCRKLKSHITRILQESLTNETISVLG